MGRMEDAFALAGKCWTKAVSVEPNFVAAYLRECEKLLLAKPQVQGDEFRKACNLAGVRRPSTLHPNVWVSGVNALESIGWITPIDKVVPKEAHNHMPSVTLWKSNIHTGLKMPTKPLPWSHSSLTTYMSCPKKFYHLKVVKDVQDSTNDAAIWGNDLHLALENRLREKVPLPPEMAMYEEYAAAIEKRPGEMYIEQQLSITKNCEPCAWDAEDVWCRGIVDVLHIDGDTAWVLDHKTGKRKPDSNQLALFALLVFYHYPQVQYCNTAFMWMKTLERDTEKFSRDDIDKLWDRFLPALKQYNMSFKKDLWTCRTSGLCRGWCPVKQCQFYEDRK